MTTLDQLYKTLSTTIRGGRPNEPSFEIIDGYVKLQFAYGYHQLGDAARAAELEAAGHAQLAEFRADPIHAWLIDAFAARIRGEHPAELQERLDAFDRITRYKLDMFREASWIIGGGNVDATGHFGRMGRPAPDLATSTASFLSRVDRCLALAEEEPEHADGYLETSLLVTDPIDPAVVASVLDRVVPRIEQMSDRRGAAFARAVALAAFAAPTRLPALLEGVAPFVEADSWQLDEIMGLLSESLAPNHRPELAALWRRVPEDARDRPEYLIGQLRHGVMPNMDVVLRAVASSDFAAQKLRVALLDAFPDRCAERWAGELFGTATDDLSTNSHFSYNAVYVVDRFVRGLLKKA